MSFLSKIKSVAKVATKVVKAPVKLQLAVANVPFKAINKITPKPLKGVVKLATLPARTFLTAPTSIASRVLQAASPGKAAVSKPKPAPARGTPAPRAPTAAARVAPAVRLLAPIAPIAPSLVAAVTPTVATLINAANPGAPTASAPPVDRIDYGDEPEAVSYDGGPSPDDDFALAPGASTDYPLPGGGDDEEEPMSETSDGFEGGLEQNDPADIGDLDYGAYFDQMHGIGSVASSLKNVGKDIAKGSASVALQVIANKLRPPTAVVAAPVAAGLSTPAKMAIGVGVAVAGIYFLTRKKSAVAT